MSFWDGKKILVTGGAGFVGSHVVEELLRRAPRARVTVADRFSAGKRDNLKAVIKKVRALKTDLSSLEKCRAACLGHDVVLHLAGRVAGVAYNSTHPATMFRENMTLACHVLEAARLQGVRRVLVVSSACVYPREAVVPTPETEGFRGRPEATNEGYGWAKRMAEYLGQSYASEFGLEVAIARPYNIYGPRDNYGHDGGHVIAGLLPRALAGENPMLVWGDGTPTRSFLYVEDAARGLLDVAERYAAADPLNLGADDEISIGDLARLIVRLTGAKAELRFDPSKPAGQPRRNCDTRKALEKIGFRARVSLEEGLRRSIEWLKPRRRSP